MCFRKITLAVVWEIDQVEERMYIGRFLSEAEKKIMSGWTRFLQCKWKEMDGPERYLEGGDRRL